jgi:hypothetical protein
VPLIAPINIRSPWLGDLDNFLPTIKHRHQLHDTFEVLLRHLKQLDCTLRVIAVINLQIHHADHDVCRIFNRPFFAIQSISKKNNRCKRLGAKVCSQVDLRRDLQSRCEIATQGIEIEKGDVGQISKLTTPLWPL